MNKASNKTKDILCLNSLQLEESEKQKKINANAHETLT